MIDYDKNVLVVPLETTQDLFNMEKSVSQIDIFAHEIYETEKIVDELRNILPQKYNILDWKHSDSSIFHAVRVEKNVMALILSIIILVAVFNIISGLTMLTNSKTKDIAILRTMGASKSSILKIFFVIGSGIGAIGTFLGVSIGLLVSLNIDKIKGFLERFSDNPLFNEEIYFLSQIPSKTDWNEVCIIVCFSLLLCFTATIYPAQKASKLDPAEALRV
jgi:lipoprotein-releasing system permease protein